MHLRRYGEGLKIQDDCGVMCLRCLILVPGVLAATPVMAAEMAAQPANARAEEPVIIEDDEMDDGIVVMAERIRGQVDTDQPPIMTLDEADVASYGASTIAELIDAVSPQTSSGRGRGDGRPVILLNGQRVSSFRVLRNIPPEAIRRMEVLPEEVALRFGYPPNQRLINFILKENYSSSTVAGEYNIPTRGGFANWELEGGSLKIDGPRRFNIDAKIEKDTLLTEAERGVIQEPRDIPTVPGDPDPAAYRSLVDASRTISLSGGWSTGLGEEGMGGTLGIDGSYTRGDTRSLSGLDTVLLTAPDGSSELRSLPDPLRRIGQTDTFEAGLALNKPLGGWQLSATLDASHAERQTQIDRRADTSALIAAAAGGTLDIAGPLPSLPDAGFDRARNRALSLSSLVTLSGLPFRLPAGEASVTVNAGFDYSRIRSIDTRTVTGPVRLKRGDASAGINVSLPIASRREGVLADIGDLSLNFSGGIDHLSDFGTLADWSAGLTWSPLSKLTLQASYLVNEAAPSLGQLGDPQILSYNVPVYDFRLGQAALVTIISGGNPGLVAEKQRDIKLSANWDLPFLQRSSLLVEYFRNDSDNVTQSFPLLTPAIEAAFPDRVVRDAAGQLVSIDRRPVTFANIESSRLRWGLNLSGSLGKDERQEEGRGGEGRGGQREGRSGGGLPGMGPRMGGGGAQPGRWNLGLYHTWRFTDRVTIASGGPVLDQLAGDAISAGGVPRHSLELEGGVFKNGVGLRLKGNWTAPADVKASGGPGSSDLRFGSVFDLGARLFVNLDQREDLVATAPFLKGMRISFEFDNIFDSRQKVTDESGLVPLAYQMDYRDARGRFVGIDLRKMF